MIFNFAYQIAYKGNAKIWWKFAYQCIMETEVKRKKNNWSWNHMLEHRIHCRKYADAYRLKLISKKISADVQKCCDYGEERLDLFNLILIRQRVDLEVEKSGKRHKEEKEKGGWFGGWWSGNKKDEDSESGDKDICKSQETHGKLQYMV